MKALMPPTAEAIEIAQAIAWLSSDEAKNINGVILPSDGGWGAV
jgi:NAD(P)-dependent dehydrogenase (short-subunit alcohol dehydrogenase family)